MRIHVKLFAILRDAAGTGGLELDVPPGTRAGAIREILARSHPALQTYLPRVALAVNRDYAGAEIELHDGDEIALIPPVSGG
jgi:molybdopterin converting factor subunit 1